MSKQATTTPQRTGITDKSNPAPNILISMSSHDSTPFTSVSVLLVTVQVQITASNGTSHVFHALLDSGSMNDFISQHAADLSTQHRHQTFNMLLLSLAHDINNFYSY